MIHTRPFAAIAAALALTGSLAACKNDAPADPAPSATASTANGTLASAIAAAPGMTVIAGALSETGLSEVFDGPGSYTVLAPDDDAFGKLGADGKALTDPANKAQLVAVLRDHVLPGHLSVDAIRKAAAARNGPVTMRTLGDGMVTFTVAGDAIDVTGADGAKARIDGAALVASNGVVLPINGLLKPPVPPAAGQ